MGHPAHLALHGLPELPLDGYRLTATDADWTRGQGPDVAGPIGALLLLLTGREAALDQLAGEGAGRPRLHRNPIRVGGRHQLARSSNIPTARVDADLSCRFDVSGATMSIRVLIGAGPPTGERQ